MANSITFRGAYVRYADIRQQDEAGVFTRIHLSADYSEPVREAMEWPLLPAEVTTAKLRGELIARTMILTPTDKSLRDQEFDIAITDVSDFQFVRSGDDEKGYQTELRFIARSQQEGAEAIIGSYIRRLGKSQGALKVSYQRQEKLDLAEQVAGKPLPLIPEPDEEETVSTDDEAVDPEGETETPFDETEAESQETQGPALASVTAMPEKMKERRQRRKRALAGEDTVTQSSVGTLPVDPGDPDWSGPIRHLILERGGAQVDLTVIEKDGGLVALFTGAVTGTEVLVEETSPCPSASHAIVAACGRLEQWARDIANASRAGSPEKGDAAVVLHWALEQAGEARQTARAN